VYRISQTLLYITVRFFFLHVPSFYWVRESVGLSLTADIYHCLREISLYKAISRSVEVPFVSLLRYSALGSRISAIHTLFPFFWLEREFSHHLLPGPLKIHVLRCWEAKSTYKNALIIKRTREALYKYGLNSVVQPDQLSFP